ncbi:hypothetical protein [Cellulomonas sp. SG140]|uniref:hypothetical protein n=1 Tax=Cellulomonas sp. SG140 TaxID=2976536 RepID=UPI0021E90F03|nr:hypothetical protein [Cellulomonas sp. SG140]
MSRSDRYRLGDVLSAVDAIDRAELVGQRYGHDAELPAVVLSGSDCTSTTSPTA